VNAIGPLRLTRALLGQLPRGAKVILMTSRMGSIEDNTSGGSYGYRMSKAALCRPANPWPSTSGPAASPWPCSIPGSCAPA
jgi:NAD(P)-dependent dehydrogenase (short-subunit alcohol dehydrogenase family)